MEEWLICEKCWIKFDENLEYCPKCNSKLTRFNLNILNNYLNNFLTIAKTVDMLDDDTLKKFFPKIYDWRVKNVYFENILMEDLFNWLIHLGLGDGEISDAELDFINTYLNYNYTKEDISKITDVNQNMLTFEFLEQLKNYDMFFNLESDTDLVLSFKNFLKLFGGLFTLYGKNPQNNKNKSDESLSNEAEEIHEDDETLSDLLDEFNKLIGLENVKKDVNSLINLVQIRKIRDERGFKQVPMSLHLVFSGNPGTGKTTVARLLSKIYQKLGILTKGHLIETDRSGLVGGYVGQTAIKTQEVITSAMGGILFIDEAYALASKSENDYGLEAIDTILKAMEDNRHDLIVIVAGYTDLMDEFLNSNPGLKSRFNKFIEFEDYSADELYGIFKLMCDDANLILDKKADKYLKDYLNDVILTKEENFANGRFVRNLFEKVLTSQANRLVKIEEITDEELNTIVISDFEDV